MRWSVTGLWDSDWSTKPYEDTQPAEVCCTIPSKPSVVARMCELLLGPRVRHGGLGRVLEIGTGCIPGGCAEPAGPGEVYTLERLRGLYDKARDNLRPFRWPTCTAVW